MPRYFGVAQKGDKTYQGFVEFESPIEVIVASFHRHGYAVDFYTNINESSEINYVELGKEEGVNNEPDVISRKR